MLNSYEAIYDQGLIQWIDQPPPLEKARVIVTVLPADNEPEKPVLRKPSPKLRGTRIAWDLTEPVVPESDWEALK